MTGQPRKIGARPFAAVAVELLRQFLTGVDPESLVHVAEVVFDCLRAEE